MSDKTKNVSKVPKITPGLLAQNEDEQKQWREMLAVPRMSADTYANTVINSNLATLESLTRQIIHSKGTDRDLLAAKTDQIRNDTAEWMSSIGRFDDALKLAVVGEQKELLNSYLKAEALDDDQWCEHPIFEYVDGQPSQIAYREFNFFSESHARQISMMRCNTCGFRNAKDLDVELRKLSEHRREVVKTGKDTVANLAEIMQR